MARVVWQREEKKSNEGRGRWKPPEEKKSAERKTWKGKQKDTKKKGPQKSLKIVCAERQETVEKERPNLLDACLLRRAIREAGGFHGRFLSPVASVANGVGAGKRSARRKMKETAGGTGAGDREEGLKKKSRNKNTKKKQKPKMKRASWCWVARSEEEEEEKEEKRQALKEGTPLSKHTRKLEGGSRGIEGKKMTL